MSPPHDPVRRAVSFSLATLLALGGTVGVATDSRDGRLAGPRPLVAYFSRSGNTRVVAGLLRRELGADLFEIQPAQPYPEDYLETVEQARKERDRGFEPARPDRIGPGRGRDPLTTGAPERTDRRD